MKTSQCKAAEWFKWHKLLMKAIPKQILKKQSEIMKFLNQKHSLLATLQNILQKYFGM